MSLEFAVSELNRRLANIIRVGVVSEVDTETARVKVATSQIVTDWIPWLTTRAGDDVSWWAPSVDEQVLVFSPSGELSAAIVFPAIYSDTKPANADIGQVHRVTYADGTMIEYDKEQSKLKVNCVGSVDVIAVDDVTVETQANVSVTAEGNVSVESGADVSVVASGNLTAQAAAAEITAPTVTINGNVTVNGTLHTSGNISSDANVSAAALLSGATIAAGGMSASGGAMSAGSVSASGDVTAGGISLASHIHSGVMGGPGTTGGPQ